MVWHIIHKIMYINFFEIGTVLFTKLRIGTVSFREKIVSFFIGTVSFHEKTYLNEMS